MSKGKLLAVSLLWLLILGVGVLVWKFVFVRSQQQAEARRKALEEQRLAEKEAEKQRRGGTSSRYEHELTFWLDAFSGYSVIRSDRLRNELGTKSIRLTLHDDKADYLARIKALKSGQANMAAFTIDALVKVCAEIEDLPATVVAVIDETTGADAIVAYRETVANVDGLNRPEMRFVLTPNSPSETLARVVMSRFNLGRLAEKPFIEAASVEEVVRRYEKAKPNEPLAYVLWEPFVSQVLKNPALHRVIDSSRFPSTIVDVLVASDDFVTEKPAVVRDFVECYLRTAYEFRDRAEMVKLVLEDARRSGTPLQEAEANKLVEGIWWKNTPENLAHMGLLQDDQGLPHIEDVISNITDILVSTGAIARDPTDGHPSYLYYSSALESLLDLRPGLEAGDRTADPPPAAHRSTVGATHHRRHGAGADTGLRSRHRTDHGTEPGRARRISPKTANARFYVVIRGNASRRGDLAQNKALAERRAKAAEQYLVGKGVDPHRIRATGVDPSGETSVSFVLGEPPY